MNKLKASYKSWGRLIEILNKYELNYIYSNFVDTKYRFQTDDVSVYMSANEVADKLEDIAALLRETARLKE